MHNKLSITFLLLVLLVATGSFFTLNGLMLLLGLSSTVAASISTLTTLGLLLWSTDSVPEPWALALFGIQEDRAPEVWVAMGAGVATEVVALAGVAIEDGAMVAAAALVGVPIVVAMGAQALVEVVTLLALVGAVIMAAINIGGNHLLAVSATVSSLALVTGLRIYKNHKQIADKSILCTLSLLIISTFLALSADALLIFALLFPSAVAFTCSYSLAVAAASVLLFAAASLLRDLSLSLRSSLMQEA